jgi:hypothetical protein
MIAVLPTNDAGAVLRLVAARPGCLDAEAIGQILWKPVIRNTADVLRVRRAIREQGAGWSKRASDLLHRLQQQGLIERQRGPQVGPGYQTGCESDLEETQGKLLSLLVRKQPSTMREWVGIAPSGNVQRAVAALAELELVVLPSMRWPTQAGRELVASWWTQAREAA